MKRKIRWTAALDEAIRARRALGESWQQVGDHIGVHQNSVWRRAMEIGLDTGRVGSREIMPERKARLEFTRPLWVIGSWRGNYTAYITNQDTSGIWTSSRDLAKPDLYFFPMASIACIQFDAEA